MAIIIRRRLLKSNRRFCLEPRSLVKKRVSGRDKNILAWAWFSSAIVVFSKPYYPRKRPCPPIIQLEKCKHSDNVFHGSYRATDPAASWGVQASVYPVLENFALTRGNIILYNCLRVFARSLRRLRATQILSRWAADWVGKSWIGRSSSNGVYVQALESNVDPGLRTGPCCGQLLPVQQMVRRPKCKRKGKVGYERVQR
jgi:hypothetical protein